MTANTMRILWSWVTGEPLTKEVVAMRLTTTGVARNFEQSIVGVLTTEHLPREKRTERILFLAAHEAIPAEDLSGYRAIISHDELHGAPSLPYIHRLRESDHLKDGDIVVLEGNAGTVRSLYRPYEQHHHLFVTERCNSNCLMCSQPPKDRDDVEALTERNLELIRLIAARSSVPHDHGRRTDAPRRPSFHADCATQSVHAGHRTPCAHEWQNVRMAGLCAAVCRA